MIKTLFFSVLFFAFFQATTFSQLVSSTITSVQFTDQYAIFERLQTEVSGPDSARTVNVLVKERLSIADTLAINGRIAELENGVKNRKEQAAQLAAQVAKEEAELVKIKGDYKKKKGKKLAVAPPPTPEATKKEAPVVSTPEQPKKKRKKQ